MKEKRVSIGCGVSNVEGTYKEERTSLFQPLPFLFAFVVCVHGTKC